MALVLCVHAGDDIYVDEDIMTVSRIINSREFFVRSSGIEFRVTDRRANEVIPGVFVSSGGRPGNERVHRDVEGGTSRVWIAINTDTSRKILRGSNYRRQRDGHGDAIHGD